MNRVLIIEDCLDDWRLIERALGTEFEIRRCEDLSSARATLETWTPDLVLLDVGLPDGEGFALCSELRGREATRDVPILFLSARHATSDKLVAFGLGADDFVDKPFHTAELRARVKARLRRRAETQRRHAIRIVGPLRVDTARFAAQIRESGTDRDLDLTPHELRILFALADAGGRAVSRTQLVSALVGECVITERTVDSHLCNLRRKLGAMRSMIETVRGVGYRLSPPRRHDPPAESLRPGLRAGEPAGPSRPESPPSSGAGPE